MKKLSTILLALCLAVTSITMCSCGRKDPEKVAFAITGLSDKTFDGSSLKQTLTVNHVSGPTEAVTLAVSGLPAGLSASLSTPTGTPPFSSDLIIAGSTGSTSGTYNITVTGTSTSGVTGSASFKLTVPDNCAYSLVGRYTYLWTYNGVPQKGGEYELTKAPAPDNGLWLQEPAAGSGSPELILLDCGEMTCELFGTGDPMSGDFTISPKKTFLFDDGDGFIIQLTAK